MRYDLIKRIKDEEFSWKEDLQQTKRDMRTVGNIALIVGPVAIGLAVGGGPLAVGVGAIHFGATAHAYLDVKLDFDMQNLLNEDDKLRLQKELGLNRDELNCALDLYSRFDDKAQKQFIRDSVVGRYGLRPYYIIGRGLAEIASEIYPSKNNS